MSQKTVLYVDDEEDIRLVVAASLKEAGHRVLTAGSVKEALSVVAAQFPDIVITDVMMPNESGYSLCEKLKADPTTRDIPVVFLTVMDDESRAIELGAAAYLSKPFDEAHLLKTVHDLLQVANHRADLDRALQHIRGGEFDSALGLLQNVIDGDRGTPLEAWGHYYAGQIHQHRSDEGKAHESFSAVLAADPTFWRAHNRLARGCEQTGDRARAIKHYERSLSLNGNQEDVRQRMQALTARRPPA